MRLTSPKHSPTSFQLPCRQHQCQSYCQKLKRHRPVQDQEPFEVQIKNNEYDERSKIQELAQTLWQGYPTKMHLATSTQIGQLSTSLRACECFVQAPKQPCVERYEDYTFAGGMHQLQR